MRDVCRSQLTVVGSVSFAYKRDLMAAAQRRERGLAHAKLALHPHHDQMRRAWQKVAKRRVRERIGLGLVDHMLAFEHLVDELPATRAGDVRVAAAAFVTDMHDDRPGL